MSKENKRNAKPVAEPPVLIAQPKSRGRRRAEIAAWSAIVFWLYFGFRIKTNARTTIGDFIRFFLSPSFQAPLKHTPDYSLGFLPRILSGQLLAFFTGGSVTGPRAGAYFLTMYVVTYGLLSLILGMLIEKAISTKNVLMAMFPLLIVFAPEAVWIRFFSHEYLDTPMFLFTLAAFFLIRNEKLKWFAPVCVCLAIMTSYSFVLLFFPLLFAIQYYELIKSGMKRTRLFNLIATAASSFAMLIYMVWAGSHSELVGRYSFEESIAYLERKIGYSLVFDIDSWYFVSTIFGKHLLDGRRLTLFNATAWSKLDFFHPLFYVVALLISAPILIFTLTIWWKHIKREKGFWQKSPYILFMLAPLLIFPVFLTFLDMDRLVSAVLFTQVLLLAYVFFSDGQNEVFMRLKEIGAGKRRWLLYAAVLLAVILPLMLFQPNALYPIINLAGIE